VGVGGEGSGSGGGGVGAAPRVGSWGGGPLRRSAGNSLTAALAGDARVSDVEQGRGGG
jgi:hypothetical protein